MTIAADGRPQTTAAPHDPPRRDPQPRWVRPGVLALLAATAVLYLWGLGAAGWANNYYAAAAQAGTQDWKALAVRIAGCGQRDHGRQAPRGAMGDGLVRQALRVQRVHHAAAAGADGRRRRRDCCMPPCGAAADPRAGLIAGAVLALTPVAALMFRFNNPDALLVLLLVAAAYCVVRATETASTRWMALAGCAIGFAFLTKMLQAFLIAAGSRAGVPRRRACRAVEADLANCSSAPPRWSCRRVGTSHW